MTILRDLARVSSFLTDPEKRPRDDYAPAKWTVSCFKEGDRACTAMLALALPRGEESSSPMLARTKQRASIADGSNGSIKRSIRSSMIEESKGGRVSLAATTSNRGRLDVGFVRESCALPEASASLSRCSSSHRIAC